MATDGGASLRDGIKTVAAQGVCPEAMWPYVEQKFAQKPPVPAISRQSSTRR